MTASRWPRLVAALLGFVWFLQLGGGPALHPLNVGWIFAGDWYQHWLGWLFFRHEPWIFPLGKIAALPYPVGTTIGFTDSNPLVSLLLKPFSGLLPDEFQFVGLWLACCFALQGYVGAALASTVTGDSNQQMLGGYLFVLSPVLLARLGHDTLCAQWLLLGVLYLGFREYAEARSAYRASWLATGAVMLAAAIHPYLAAMSFALALACFARFWRTRVMTPGRAAMGALATAAGMLAVFAAIGDFGAAGIGSDGFGRYSADLLTLINPYVLSRSLPGLPMSPGQWEGIGFVGFGGLVAAAMAAIAVARTRPAWRAGVGSVIVVCALLGAYALSSNITFAGEPIARARRLYHFLPFLTSPFRASGRFIWPLHYVTLLAGIWGATRLGRSRQSAGTALLAVVVVLQAADLNSNPSLFSRKEVRQAPVRDFALAAGHYQHLALFPMQVQGACGDSFGKDHLEDHVYRFMLLAYRLEMTYNSGVFARLPAAAVHAECARLEAAVSDGRLDPQTIYVPSPSAVPLLTAAGAACGRFDGDWICVSAGSDPAFRRYVETGK